MASLAAENVAKEVLGKIGKGEKPNITKIAVKNGYSYKTANAGIVQKTQSYKKIVEPFINRLINHREKIVDQMEETLGRANYADTTRGLDRTTNVIQLLTGGATQNIAIGVKKLSDDELQHLATGGEEGTSKEGISS